MKDFQPNIKAKILIIDNFLNHEMASRIEESLSEIKPTDEWYQYDNLFEKKLATDKICIMPQAIKQMLYELNGQDFVKYLETLTGIDGLIPDPFLRGGGIHAIPIDGFLDLHTDRNFHPKLKLYRRVNVLLYFNRSYIPSYQGQLELWNSDLTECKYKIEPIYNRAVIFNTDATSFHGHPSKWMSTRPRMSLAAYYYTSTIPEDFKANMKSTDFRARPTDDVDPVKDKMREDRKQLRING